jgi:hypothetical protein
VFEDPRYSPRRRVDPPIPVLVDPAQLWPPTRIRWGTDTPLWCRNHGVQLTRPLDGMLLEWIATATGDWCGLVRLAVPVAGQDVHLTQLVPQKALQPRDSPAG